MPTKRPPTGDAGGAAGGQFPNISVGNPPLMGLSLHDEFLRLGSVGDYGDTRLTLTTLGTTPAVTQTTPTTQLESGVLKLSTGDVSSNEGGVMGHPVAAWCARPAIGALYVAKVRAVDSWNIEVWTGFASAAATVKTADSTEFIGFRFVGAGWEGVVKNGSGGGNENTVTLLALADTAWHTFGFRYIATHGQTSSAYGVQFYILDADNTTGPFWFETGDLITTNIPTTAMLMLPLGLTTTDGTSKAAEMDYYTLGGHMRR